MKPQDLKDKKVSILGMGRSGTALARVLSAMGANLLVSDSRSNGDMEPVKNELADLPLEWESGGHTDRVYEGRDLIIISPGVSIYHPVLQKAIEKAVPVISEVEMAYRLAEAPFVAITGTNGKSTTSTLIHQTLLSGGKKSFLAGNIGIPLVGEVGKIPACAHIVAEISSFQLEAVDEFRPKVAVLLNITVDHIDRHGSFENYVQAKANLFRNQKPEDFAVLNADDPAVMSISGSVPSRKLFFSRKGPVEEGVYLSGGFIKYRFNGQERVVFPLDMLPLKGAHNQENVMAVICVCLALGIRMEALLQALQEFKPLHYRMQYVDTIDGVKFYNDSKGTNPDAVRASLESFSEPLSLIAGGTDKNLDFSLLADKIAGTARHVVLIGESRQKIATALKAVGYENITIIDSFELEGFKTAIRTAFEKIRPEGVVLLSPSCASFDMFHRAEHRGEMFDQYVRELKAEYECKEKI